MEKFCTNCGSGRAGEAKFCGSCGLPFEGSNATAENAGKVFVKNSDRRIPVGSASLQENDTIMEVGGVWVSPKSDEAKNAGAVFDPKVIPTEGSLVPADCIWSVHAYPGTPNVRSQNPKKAMVEMGQLVGRPFDEIVEHVGAPNSRQAGEEGIFACVWMEVGFLSAWTITLVFDSYGVCASVVNESAF
jgi:hypothetical protein